MKPLPDAPTCSGGPSATTIPPPDPPSGAMSMIQSAVLMTSRLCLMTTIVLACRQRPCRVSRRLPAAASRLNRLKQSLLRFRTAFSTVPRKNGYPHLGPPLREPRAELREIGSLHPGFGISRPERRRRIHPKSPRLFGDQDRSCPISGQEYAVGLEGAPVGRH